MRVRCYTRCSSRIHRPGYVHGRSRSRCAVTTAISFTSTPATRATTRSRIRYAPHAPRNEREPEDEESHEHEALASQITVGGGGIPGRHSARVQTIHEAWRRTIRGWSLKPTPHRYLSIRADSTPAVPVSSRNRMVTVTKAGFTGETTPGAQ